MYGAGIDSTIARSVIVKDRAGPCHRKRYMKMQGPTATASGISRTVVT